MPTLEQRLLQVRPALLAVWLKRLLGVRRRVVESRDGVKVFIDPVSHMGREILDTGTYEPDMVNILSNLLRPMDVYFDAGVNEGYFACFAAKVVGPGGKVFGAEPQARLMDVIARNFELNGVRNAVVENVALSEKDGQTVLYLSPDTNSGASSFFRSTRVGSRPQAVKTLALDSVLDTHGIERVRFMKVDCEGAEEAIIAGASSALAARRFDFIMIELHPSITGEGAPVRVDTILRANGYALAQIANGGWIYHLPGTEAALLPLGPFHAVGPLSAR